MSDVPRATRLNVRWAMLLVVMGLIGSFWVGSMWGWARGYREAEGVHNRGWNAVTRTAGERAHDADLDRLLGQRTATECYETLYDLERPLPLLTALQRASRESDCLTEAVKAMRQRVVPQVPAGQVRPLSWGRSSSGTLPLWIVSARLLAGPAGRMHYGFTDRLPCEVWRDRLLDGERRGVPVSIDGFCFEASVNHYLELAKGAGWGGAAPLAGQVRPIAWPGDNWLPGIGWWRAAPVRRDAILPALQAKFPRLDLVVEYPFGPSEGAWVTLGGCLADGQEARATRKALYEVRGVAAVFDRTTRTPTHDPKVPRYVESACSGDWLHDGRQVARWLMTPRRAQDPKAERRVPLAKLIPDPDHRARVLSAMETDEELQSRGLWVLATALSEIHKRLYRDAYPETDADRVASVKMMFDVWARMPAPGKE